MDEHEEFEQIPWSELTTRPPDKRKRLMYMVAGGVGVLVLVVLAARAFTSSAPAQPAAPAVTVAQTDTSVAGEVASTTAVAAAPAPSLLYREADLMAFPATPAERAAVARAEWFVTDYFTADLEPSGSTDVRAALPGGAVLPEMPQDSVSGLSYVEWARAFRVEEIEEGRFRVAVAFRALGAPPESGFYRLPVRAVEVTVAVSADGGSTVVDLPTPVPLPAGPEPGPWPEAAEAPQWVLEAALGEAAGWGLEPRLLATHSDGLAWRVVLTLADEVGNRWPMAVWVDGRAPGGG